MRARMPRMLCLRGGKGAMRRASTGRGSVRRPFFRRGGFTLLETLLAMAISVVLVGALVTAIYQFAHLTKTYRNALTTGAQLQTVATAMNGDVISASSGRVIVNGNTQQLAMRVLFVSSTTFGEPTLPAPQYITYTYTTSGANAGMLIRQSSAGQRVVARDIQALSFGPSRTITSAVWVDVTVMVGDQTQSETLLLHRRPSE